MAVIYLDANASVPPLPKAKRALIEAADAIGNPSSTHELGRNARTLLDRARDDVARALGADPRDVIFTSGASEANRWLVDAVSRLQLTQTAPLVLVSHLEHPSLAKPLALSRGTEVHFLDDKRVDIAKADVVFCTAAHNETGLIPGLDDLLACVSPRCIVCVDAAQAVARVQALPRRVDAIVASAHKIGAFAGAGALVVRGNARKLLPPWLGGGQEANMRPGTEALVLHAAFGAACKVIDDTRAKHRALRPLRDKIERALVDAWGARALCSDQNRLENTSALVVTGVDGDVLRIAIDGAGVCVGFGAACSSLVPEPSPSLLAMGLSEDEARATVRISLSPSTTAEEIDEAIARLIAVAPTIERARKRRSRGT